MGCRLQERFQNSDCLLRSPEIGQRHTEHKLSPGCCLLSMVDCKLRLQLGFLILALLQVDIGQQIVGHPTVGIDGNCFFHGHPGVVVFASQKLHAAEQCQSLAVMRIKPCCLSKVGFCLLVIFFLEKQVAEQEMQRGAGRR